MIREKKAAIPDEDLRTSFTHERPEPKTNAPTTRQKTHSTRKSAGASREESNSTANRNNR